MAYYTYSYTATTITITIHGLTPGVSKYRFFCVLENNGTDVDVLLSDTDYTNKYYGTKTATDTEMVCTVARNMNFTYRVNAAIDYVTQTGATIQAGSESGGNDEGGEEGSRPSDWAWQSTIAKGQPIQISAMEWSDFCDRINEFREYKNLTAYNFTSVSRGTEISAAIVNQAWTAINAISGHGTMPSAAVSDGLMYASFFTGLASALNAIS